MSTEQLQATLQDNGSIRVWCPIGVVFPGGTQEFGPDGQPTGYAVFWPSTALAGATETPEEGRSVANAGEFAAMWNAKEPQEREDFLVQLLHQQERTMRCYVEDHDGLKEELRALQIRVVELQLERSPAPRWDVKYMHDACPECEDCAERAVQRAIENNLVASTWTVMVPGDYGKPVLGHTASVSR